MTTELAIKYHDCFRRKIGEHDMVECRFCDQQGHNDVVGDYHGVKHRTNCPVVSALAARPQEQASQPTDDVKLLVPKQYQGNAYYHKGFEAGARWKALRSGTNSLADSLGDMLALFDDEGNFREDYQDQASVAIERAQENLDG